MPRKVGREEEARFRAVQIAKLDPKLGQLLLQLTSQAGFDWSHVLSTLEEQTSERRARAHNVRILGKAR